MMEPLTTLERQALDRLRARGHLTVGQRVDRFSAHTRGLQSTDVFTPVARGLERRGLVKLSRPNPRGPLVMTLPEGGDA